MTAILGWAIFLAGLLGASAAIILLMLFVLKGVFPRLKLGLVTVAVAVTGGAIALWFIIPAVTHANFGAS